MRRDSRRSRRSEGGASQYRVSPWRRFRADPFYYLNNFKTVLSSLEMRYRRLLSAEELQFIEQFAELPQVSSALLVRMIMRRGALFRLSRLRYPEIGDAAGAAMPLFEIGWLTDAVLDATQLCRLLTKEELISHLGGGRPRALRRLNKSALSDLICERYPEPRSFQEWCSYAPDRVFDAAVKPIAERLRLIFFGNFHQDWTEFVLADLGIHRYEAVPLKSTPFRAGEHLRSSRRADIVVPG